MINQLTVKVIKDKLIMKIIAIVPALPKVTSCLVD